MGDIVTPIRRLLRRAPALHTRIAIERTLAGLNASHCARAFGCSHTVWQRIESGQRSVDAPELKRIARIVGCTVQRLRGQQAQVAPGYRRMGRPPTRVEVHQVAA